MQSCSGYMAQIIKAKWFIAEPSRFEEVDPDTFFVRGHSATHVLVRMEDGTWCCDCAYSRQGAAPCAHARALEKLISDKVLGSTSVGSPPQCELVTLDLSCTLAFSGLGATKEVY